MAAVELRGGVFAGGAGVADRMRGEGLAVGPALDGDFAAFAVVLRGVDGDGVGLARGAGGVLLPVAGVVAGDVAHGLEAVVFERDHVAGGLADGGGDVAVGEDVVGAGVGDGDGRVLRSFCEGSDGEKKDASGREDGAQQPRLHSRPLARVEGFHYEYALRFGKDAAGVD